MELTVVVESWHIRDGNYPPLHRGQSARFAFEMQGSTWPSAEADGPALVHLGDARYRGHGEVVRYDGEGWDRVAVIETGDLRFAVGWVNVNPLNVGVRVAFRGTLMLRHVSDAPDLYHTLRVVRIRDILIPERLIGRRGSAVISPTSVDPEDFGAVTEVETMERRTVSIPEARHWWSKLLAARRASAAWTPAFWIVDLVEAPGPAAPEQEQVHE